MLSTWTSILHSVYPMNYALRKAPSMGLSVIRISDNSMPDSDCCWYKLTYVRGLSMRSIVALVLRRVIDRKRNVCMYVDIHSGFLYVLWVCDDKNLVVNSELIGCMMAENYSIFAFYCERLPMKYFRRKSTWLVVCVITNIPARKCIVTLK